MDREQKTQYILQQRAAGVPDGQIYDKLYQSEQEPPQRSGAGEFLPTAFAIGGGMLGGIGGAIGGPAGAFAGGVAGATAGGALGEFVQQSIEKRFGERDKYSAPQIAASGTISGAFQATGVGVVKAAGAVARPVAAAVRPRAVSFLRYLSGYNDEVIAKALERSGGTVRGMAGGEGELVSVIQRAATGLQSLAKKSVADGRAVINGLTKRALSEDALLAKALNSAETKYAAARTEIFNKAGNFLRNTVASLRQNHNIGVSQDGTLSFLRGNQPSRIVSKAEQSAIQEAYNLLRSVRNNLSLKHVDSIYERLIVLKSKTPAGTPTGTETKALIGEMMGQLRGFIEKVYPKEYTAALNANLQRRVYINEAQELLGTSANPSPKEIQVISNRLLQLFNTGRLAPREMAEKVGEELGEDIVGTTAGTLLKTGGQISARASNLTKRGITEKIVEALPRSMLNSYIKTGELTADIVDLPIIKTTARAFGISVKALVLEITNLLANKTTR